MSTIFSGLPRSDRVLPIESDATLSRVGSWRVDFVSEESAPALYRRLSLFRHTSTDETHKHTSTGTRTACGFASAGFKCLQAVQRARGPVRRVAFPKTAFTERTSSSVGNRKECGDAHDPFRLQRALFGLHALSPQSRAELGPLEMRICPSMLCSGIRAHHAPLFAALAHSLCFPISDVLLVASLVIAYLDAVVELETSRLQRLIESAHFFEVSSAMSPGARAVKSEDETTFAVKQEGTDEHEESTTKLLQENTELQEALGSRSCFESVWCKSDPLPRRRRQLVKHILHGNGRAYRDPTTRPTSSSHEVLASSRGSDLSSQESLGYIGHFTFQQLTSFLHGSAEEIMDFGEGRGEATPALVCIVQLAAELWEYERLLTITPDRPHGVQVSAFALRDLPGPRFRSLRQWGVHQDEKGVRIPEADVAANQRTVKKEQREMSSSTNSPLSSSSSSSWLPTEQDTLHWFFVDWFEKLFLEFRSSPEFVLDLKARTIRASIPLQSADYVGSANSSASRECNTSEWRLRCNPVRPLPPTPFLSGALLHIIASSPSLSPSQRFIVWTSVNALTDVSGERLYAKIPSLWGLLLLPYSASPSHAPHPQGKLEHEQNQKHQTQRRLDAKLVRPLLGFSKSTRDSVVRRFAQLSTLPALEGCERKIPYERASLPRAYCPAIAELICQVGSTARLRSRAHVSSREKGVDRRRSDGLLSERGDACPLHDVEADAATLAEGNVEGCFQSKWGAEAASVVLSRKTLEVILFTLSSECRVFQLLGNEAPAANAALQSAPPKRPKLLDAFQKLCVRKVQEAHVRCASSTDIHTRFSLKPLESDPARYPAHWDDNIMSFLVNLAMGGHEQLSSSLVDAALLSTSECSQAFLPRSAYVNVDRTRKALIGVLSASSAFSRRLTLMALQDNGNIVQVGGPIDFWMSSSWPLALKRVADPDCTSGRGLAGHTARSALSCFTERITLREASAALVDYGRRLANSNSSSTCSQNAYLRQRCCRYGDVWIITTRTTKDDAGRLFLMNLLARHPHAIYIAGCGVTQYGVRVHVNHGIGPGTACRGVGSNPTEVTLAAHRCVNGLPFVIPVVVRACGSFTEWDLAQCFESDGLHLRTPLVLRQESFFSAGAPGCPTQRPPPKGIPNDRVRLDEVHNMLRFYEDAMITNAQRSTSRSLSQKRELLRSFPESMTRREMRVQTVLHDVDAAVAHFIIRSHPNYYSTDGSGTGGIRGCGIRAFHVRTVVNVNDPLPANRPLPALVVERICGTECAVDVDECYERATELARVGDGGGHDDATGRMVLRSCHILTAAANLSSSAPVPAAVCTHSERTSASGGKRPRELQPHDEVGP